MQPDIIALGEPLYELSARQEGDLRTAKSFQVGFGGDTSNFAVAAARSGARAGYLSRVGADPFGDALLDLWRREGVDAAHVQRDPGAATGLYFIARGPGGHSFTYYRAGSAASRMTPDLVPAGYVAGAKLLHVSGISLAISQSARQTAMAAISVARASGVTVSFDTNLRLNLWPMAQARKAIHTAAALADIVFPSLDEARDLTGLDAPEAICAYYAGLGATTVVLKLGAQGALLHHEGATTHHQAPTVTELDASGAGDCFDGAFAAQYITGAPLETCARYACAAAALSVQGLGAVAPIPTRKTILATL